MEKRRREGMSGEEAKGYDKRRRESMSGEEAKGGGRERQLLILPLDL